MKDFGVKVTYLVFGFPKSQHQCNSKTLITTLFNLFCPFVCYSLNLRLFLLLLRTSRILFFVSGFKKSWLKKRKLLFTRRKDLLWVSRRFILVAVLNLFSLLIFRFPVTTTLSFNFSIALFLWISRVLITFSKMRSGSMLLPSNSPWYLVFFLSL